MPLALIGTFAAMYALGFSLDNLSLMGAEHRRRLRRRRRHRHDREHRAASRNGQVGDPGGRSTAPAEIGFTIVSISLSLVAVFIPLLLLGGIVGRLFREFAVTVTMTIVVSAFVSLTLTPMMCARFLQTEKQPAVTAGSTWRRERAFDALLDGYRRTLDVALRHHRLTFAIFLGDAGRPPARCS